MSDGRMVRLYGVGEVGTHHAFVNLVAKISWALKGVARYRLEVTSIDAGVAMEAEAWLPEAQALAVSLEIRAAGLRCPDPTPGI